MSSTGVRDSNSNDKRIIKGLILNEAQFIQSLRVFANTSTLSGLGSTEGEINNSPKDPSGNYLSRLGDKMLGPFALSPPLDFTIEIDANNTIDIGPLNDNAQYTSNVQLDDVQPNSSVLDIIAGAAFDGQILILRTFAPTIPYTISQGTLGNGGNIQTGDGNDLTVGDLQTVTLIFDEALMIEANLGGSWRVLSVSSGGGGGGFTDPLTQLLITLSTATLPSTTTVDTNTATEFQITLDENIEFDFTGGPASGRDQVLTLFILQDGTGGFTIDWGTKVTNPPDIDLLPNASTTIVLVSRNQGTSWTVESASPGGGGSTLPVSDVTSIVKGSVDPTKQMRFEVDGFDTATTRVMTLPNADGTVFITPAFEDLDANGKSINNLLSLDIEDSAGDTKLNISGPLGEGARFSFVTGDKVFFTENITDILTISNAGIDMLSHSITNTSFIESDTANRPSSGFIRMAQTDQVRWRNVLNDDDIYINAERPTLGVTTQDAFAFTIASGVRMYIGEFDISVEQNNILNTGDVLPSGTGGAVGDATNFYNQMHSQFFVPEGATIIANRYGLAKTGNTLYVNFDDTNIDAGFGIYEQGVQRFLFSRFGSTPFVNELFIGGDPFLAGEEYRIQLGENSVSSARIFFIEGTGNDLILDRAGAGTDQGVQIRGSGLSIARFLSDKIKIFQPLDANSKDLFNVVDIKSNGGGGATTGTIGELITANGGFNYSMRSDLFWESDANVKLTFSSDGITLETNGGTDHIEIKAQGANSNIDINANTTGILSLGRTGINHLQFASGVTQFSNANIILATGTQEIQFLDAISNASVSTPAANDITLFNDAITGDLSVKKDDGSTVNLETVGGVSPLTTKGDIFTFDTANARLPVGSDGEVLTANSAVALGVEWAAGGGSSNQISQGDSSIIITDLGVGSISVTVDTTEYMSFGGNAIILTQNVVLQGFTDIQGNVDLGNAITDTISFEGRVDTSILPSIDLSFDLGSIDNTWGSLYSRNIFFDDVNIKIQKSGSDLFIETSLGNDIVFREDITEFLRMDGGLNQVTFLREAEFNNDIRLDNGSRIRSHDSTEIGLYVTNETSAVGAFGSLQPPVNPGNAVDAATADSDFGPALGNVGTYLSGGGTPVIVQKMLLSPSTWLTMIVPSSGNVVAGRLT